MSFLLSLLLKFLPAGFLSRWKLYAFLALALAAGSYILWQRGEIAALRVDLARQEAETAQAGALYAAAKSRLNEAAIASAYQQDKINALTAEAARRRKRDTAIIHDLDAQPAPASVEEARRWALAAIERMKE